MPRAASLTPPVPVLMPQRLSLPRCVTVSAPPLPLCAACSLLLLPMQMNACVPCFDDLPEPAR